MDFSDFEKWWKNEGSKNRKFCKFIGLSSHKHTAKVAWMASNLHAKQSAVQIDNPTESRCIVCGEVVEFIRPGKWQCNTPGCNLT